jgi:hypothetical protein
VIDLTQVVEVRLRDETAPTFKLVGGLPEYEALNELSQLIMPAIYVLPVREIAQPYEVHHLNNEQVHDCDFAVIFVARLSKSSLLTEASSNLHNLRSAVLNAIVGWAPEDTSGQIAFESGELVDFGNLRTVWKDTFTVRRYIRTAT